MEKEIKLIAENYPEYENIRNTILNAKEKVVNTVNSAMVTAYWNVGKMIYEAQDGNRAEYGKQLIKYTAKQLTEEFGRGFDERNLRYMRQFYESFQKWNAVRSELSWTHYRLLMRIKEPEKINYYIDECIINGWSARQLERQINSFYYERILATNESKRVEVKYRATYGKSE